MNSPVPKLLLATILPAVAAPGAIAREAQITVHADRVRHRLTRYLTGACIEDVNHEIYGGIYSQMVFGESFQEPPVTPPPKGFQIYGGAWRVRGGQMWVDGGNGPKLVGDHPAFAAGEAGVELLLPDRGGGNAGLIVKVSEPGEGADRFIGYEVSLDARRQVLVLGRHRHNWEHLRDTPCKVPVNQWITLAVRMTEQTLEVLVNGRTIVQYDDREHPLRSGRVGLRPWQRKARFRNLWVKTGGATTALPFEPPAEGTAEISRMWRAVRRGPAKGHFALDAQNPFAGGQAQRVAFLSGKGEVGVENRGLNRWGMCFVAGRPYEGYLWARAEEPVDLFVALENADGSKVHAETRLRATGRDWQRLDFTLVPGAADAKGRFAVKLKQPGSVTLGHAFLQPGEWGRFKGLPVRRDVAEALIDQGITVLRYGGSMINHREYRWKKMIGPRDRRPPYQGTWYPYSSNGWGILDFLDFCEAAGFLGIPAFNMDETPRDMADFVRYVNGPADTPWGRKRAADGHPEPYRLKYLELGNEEKVDEDYYRRFKALAEAVWASDPEIILVVGDFVYREPIRDPLSFRGAASGITGMAAHKKILDLAREHGREVWFDIHVWTADPQGLGEVRAAPSYVEALGRIAGGAKHKVVVFELNATNHAHRRALANACSINAMERIGDRVPIVCSANCLQPDGQNDNGWDQGLLFLNPCRVWLQPPGYVTQMISRNYQPLLVEADTQSPGDTLDVTAKRSGDGKTLVLQVVNASDEPVATRIRLAGFTPSRPTASVEELAGPLDAVNTAEAPGRIRPRRIEWQHELAKGMARYTFPPRSFTILRLE